MTGRIIVADDHPLFREGMLSILQRLLPEARIEEAGDLAGVLRLAGEGEQPDSLILDLRFPGLTRIEMLADLRRRFPRTTLIVVSMVDDPQLIGEVMNAGADGFLGKSIAPEELGRAILAIRAGEVLVRYEPSGLLPLQPSPRLEGSPSANWMSCACWPKARATRRSAAPWTSPTTRCASMCRRCCGRWTCRRGPRRR